MSNLTAAPKWFSSVPAERQVHLTGSISKRDIRRSILLDCKVQVTTRNGEVFDGVIGKSVDRNAWSTDDTYAIAMQIEGRKSQKWILASDIAEMYSDKGPSLGELFTQLLDSEPLEDRAARYVA